MRWHIGWEEKVWCLHEWKSKPEVRRIYLRVLIIYLNFVHFVNWLWFFLIFWFLIFWFLIFWFWIFSFLIFWFFFLVHVQLVAILQEFNHVLRCMVPLVDLTHCGWEDLKTSGSNVHRVLTSYSLGNSFVCIQWCWYVSYVHLSFCLYVMEECCCVVLFVSLTWICFSQAMWCPPCVVSCVTRPKWNIGWTVFCIPMPTRLN